MEEEKNIENGNVKKKKKKGLKIFLIILLVLVILLASIIGFAIWFVNDKLNKIQKVDINVEELGVAEQTEEQLEEYRNIALFGIDSRADVYSQGNRSDCIMILSINNKTNDVKLFSVYRDTYLDIDGHGLDKVTHAYSYGEAPLAIKTLNTNLDLNIKEFVAVNFNALVHTIDKIGGVTIDVNAEELKHINNNASSLAKLVGSSTSKLSGPGRLKLDGPQAVTYSRIRYTEGGDYKRTERMRTVFTAMIEEMKKKNVFELNGIVDEILPHVYTNISSGEILSTLQKLPSYKIQESIGWPYNTRGITLDRWYGVPITLESNVLQLHKELFGQEDYVVPDSIKEISNRIVKKTGYTK